MHFCIGYLGGFFLLIIISFGILSLVVRSISGSGFQAAGLVCKNRQKDHGARLELNYVCPTMLAFIFIFSICKHYCIWEDKFPLYLNVFLRSVEKLCLALV